MVITFLFWAGPPLIIASTFGMYIYLGNEITASKAFTTIMLLNLLQFSLTHIPSCLLDLIQIWSSLKRIGKFLKGKNINYNSITYHKLDKQEYAI